MALIYQYLALFTRIWPNLPLFEHPKTPVSDLGSLLDISDDFRVFHEILMIFVIFVFFMKLFENPSWSVLDMADSFGMWGCQNVS